MGTYEAFRRSRHLGGLDGLRALAISAVMAHHIGLGGLVAKGVLGVTTFFAISGFLVTTILLREHESTGTISLRNFHTRRALRIWPLYFAMCAVYVALVAFVEKDQAVAARFHRNLPHFLTFTTNWVDRVAGRSVFIFSWSLATQEQFYLVWPSVLRFGKAGVVPVAVLTFLLLLDQAVSFAAGAGLVSWDALLVRAVARSVWTPICLGGLLAFALHSPRGFRIVNAVAGRPWSAPLGLLLVIVGAYATAVPRVVFELCVAYLIAAAVLGASAPVRRVLDAPPLVHVGVVSYGIYLMHMLAVNVARRIVPFDSKLAVFAIALPLSIALATLSHRYFESRFLGLREKLILRPQGPPSPAT